MFRVGKNLNIFSVQSNTANIQDEMVFTKMLREKCAKDAVHVL